MFGTLVIDGKTISIMQELSRLEERTSQDTLDDSVGELGDLLIELADF